jgi:hypothetical protein
MAEASTVGADRSETGQATHDVVALVEDDGADWSDMDKETIQQIAAEVVARLPFGDRYWLFLIIEMAVIAIAAAVAAFGGSYLRTRGQHFGH